MTSVVCISDIHGELPKIPECDLLLIAGDVCPLWDHNRQYQAKWLRNEFTKWMRGIPAKEIAWCGGNHDFVLQDSKLGDELPGHYLQDSSVELFGLKIYGSPWSTKFGNWAFMETEGQLADRYRKIPRDIDVLITHGPPNGVGDAVPRYVLKDGDRFQHMIERTGSTGLANQLHYEVWESLKLIVFGHIHEGYGEYTSSKGVRMLNVSHLPPDCDPAYPRAPMRVTL